MNLDCLSMSWPVLEISYSGTKCPIHDTVLRPLTHTIDGKKKKKNRKIVLPCREQFRVGTILFLSNYNRAVQKDMWLYLRREARTNGPL